MITIKCLNVSSGWPDVANPDDLTVQIELGRTTHEFYPSLRDMVLLYDALQEKREIERAIGTGDFISTSYSAEGEVRINLPPLEFVTAKDTLLSELESAIRQVFLEKDGRASHQERAEGISAIQSWIDQQGGSINVQEFYKSQTA
jgi:hypothetical protein